MVTHRTTDTGAVSQDQPHRSTPARRGVLDYGGAAGSAFTPAQ